MQTEKATTTLFLAFVAEMERSGLPYCILAGFEGYPDVIPSDVDFMVLPEHMPLLPALIERVARTTDSNLVQALRHETTACYFVLARREGESFAFLHPDLSTDYRRGGRIWLSAADLLSRRRLHPKGFYVTSPEDAFAYYLIKKLDKGALSDEQGSFLRARYLEDPEGCRRRLLTLLSASSARFLEEAIRRADWDGLRLALPRLTRELQRDAPLEGRWRRMRQGLAEFRRRLDRVLQPTGMLVAFLGPDGCGKSSVLTGVHAALAPAFRQTRAYHLRPRLGGHAASSTPTTQPHLGPARGPLASIAKIAYFLLDYGLGFAMRVRPQLVCSTLVTFDRYFHDLLVDPTRYRYGGPRWLARVAARLVPQPDLWIVLDAPAEVLLARKQEVSPEEAARQRAAYRALAQTLPHARVVDATRPLDQVIGQVSHEILTMLAARTARRLELEP